MLKAKISCGKVLEKWDKPLLHANVSLVHIYPTKAYFTLPVVA